MFQLLGWGFLTWPVPAPAPAPGDHVDPAGGNQEPAGENQAMGPQRGDGQKSGEVVRGQVSEKEEQNFPISPQMCSCHFKL